MDFLVQSRSKRAQKFVEHIMPSLINQLGLQGSKKCVYIEISKNVEEGNDGATWPLPELGSFVISLRLGSWEKIGVTLAHEMVHVKQLAKGTLRATNGKKYWRGKFYSKRVGYLDTPWEREAFAKQEILFRKAIGE